MFGKNSFLMALSLLSGAFLAGCKSSKTSSASGAHGVQAERSSPSARALSHSALLETEVELVRLGTVWFDKPNETFLNSQGIFSLKKELLSATTQESSTWHFERCGAVFPNPDSINPNDCAYMLEQNSGVAFEFFFIPANAGKPCTSLSEICSIHQAVRVKAWNSGLQRPALFVAKRPLKAELAAVLATPSSGVGDTLIALATTNLFPNPLATHLSQSLDLGNVRLENLIHLSNHWMEKNQQAQLTNARWQAFHTVSLGMAIGGTASAISSIGTAHQLTSFGKILLGLDLVSSPAGAINSAVKLFQWDKLATQMPPGSAKTTLQVAMMISSAAPWLAATNYGANLISLSSKFTLHANILMAMAKQNRTLLADLSQKAVTHAAKVADTRTAQLAETFRTGDWNAAANEINTAISVSGATLVENSDGEFNQTFSRWREAKNPAEAKTAIRGLAQNANQIYDQNALRVGSGNCLNASYALVQRLRGHNVSAIPYALPADGITQKMLTDIVQHMGETIVKQTADVETTIEAFDAWLRSNLSEGQVALVQSWARNGETPLGHATIATKRFGEVIHINNQFSGDIISTIPMWDSIWKGYFGNAIGYSAFVLGKNALP